VIHSTGINCFSIVSFIHLLVVPSDKIIFSFFEMLPRTVSVLYSYTRGNAPSSLNPGLLILNPFRVRFYTTYHWWSNLYYALIQAFYFIQHYIIIHYSFSNFRPSVSFYSVITFQVTVPTLSGLPFSALEIDPANLPFLSKETVIFRQE
jgi:hypothetical protein